MILRDASAAKAWARPIARWLMSREARALAALDNIEGVPRILGTDAIHLRRTFIAGEVMHVARPADANYFKAAAKLLRRIHREGVVHNDLAKEPNWLVTADGTPALLDFQLAWFQPERGRLFRTLAREDLRHLLKHKRTYCPELITKREQVILDNPALISRIWRCSGKRLYLFITRRIFGWQDRKGPGERR